MRPHLIQTKPSLQSTYLNKPVISPGLNWDSDGKDWPNRRTSIFVNAAGINWHVQKYGHGPQILLLHGTGSATHTWRDLGPLLAREFTVIAPDLPGHGFTDTPADDILSLPGMAASLNALVKEMKLCPVIVAGHSAGAAILAKMALNKYITPRWLVSINGAFLPFDGVAGVLFSPLAKLLAKSSMSARLFSLRASNEAAVLRLMSGTGSSIDEKGMKYYSRLFRDPTHVAATLKMMANWDLHALIRDMPYIDSVMAMVIGEKDKMIPATDGEKVIRIVNKSRRFQLPDAGHLAHEEKPEAIAQIVSRLVRKPEQY